MSEKKNNSRKRTVVTIILLLIALLLGIERCVHRTGPTDGEGARKETETSGKPEQLTSTAPVAQNVKRVYHHKRNKSCPKTVAVIQADKVPPITTEISNKEEKPSLCIMEEKKDTIMPDTVVEKVMVKEDVTHVHKFRLGIRAGAGYSAITSLGAMMEDYNVRPLFTLDEKGSIVFRGGVFATWRYGKLGAELGVDYMRLSGSVEKYTSRLDMSENTKVNCDVISPQLMFRFYPFRDFYMSAGALMAIPFHTEVNYSTNRTGTLYMQQDHLKALHLCENVESKLHFMPALKIGYVCEKIGLEAALEYNYGVNDLLRTVENDYGYAERTNNSHYFGVNVGYTISIGEIKRKKK